MSSLDLFVLIYEGEFDPSNPCDSLFAAVFANETGSFKTDFIVYLPEEFYTFVVMSPVNASTTESSSGMFVLSWNALTPLPVEGNTNFSSCVTETSGLPYSVFAPSSGYYSLSVWAVLPNDIVKAATAVVDTPTIGFQPSLINCSLVEFNSTDGRIEGYFESSYVNTFAFFGPPETSSFITSNDDSLFQLIRGPSYYYTIWEPPYIPPENVTNECYEPDGERVRTKTRKKKIQLAFHFQNFLFAD
jgi:hypothetical protein